jgi:hypothetical protein
MVVTEFRELRKGSSLQGFATIELPSGLVLHDCAYHRREDGARWIGLPARQYTKADGETAWARIVDFADKGAAARFQREAMAAIDRYFKQQETGVKRSLDSTLITDADCEL